MRVVFLGSGTSTGIPQIGCACTVCCSENPKDKRLRSSVLVEVEDKNILIDCGPDFRQQMLTHKVKTIDAVLLTHNHYDHISGLDELRSFDRGKGVDLYLEKYVEESVRRCLPYCFAENRYPGVATLNLKQIGDSEFKIDDIEVQPIRVMHYNLPILGFKIGTMAYITDMLTISDGECEKLNNLDVLIVNALRHTPHISHQTLSDALKLIEKVKPRKAYVTHISHGMGLHDEEIAKLPSNVTFAYDNLVITI